MCVNHPADVVNHERTVLDNPVNWPQVLVTEFLLWTPENIKPDWIKVMFLYISSCTLATCHIFKLKCITGIFCWICALCYSTTTVNVQLFISESYILFASTRPKYLKTYLRYSMNPWLVSCKAHSIRNFWLRDIYTLQSLIISRLKQSIIGSVKFSDLSWAPKKIVLVT